MNKQGTIRELHDNESLRSGEIPLSTAHATKLAAMQPAARREYYRTVRSGISRDTALACAESRQRRLLASAPHAQGRTSAPLSIDSNGRIGKVYKNGRRIT
jgi:hypothetical protein